MAAHASSQRWFSFWLLALNFLNLLNLLNLDASMPAMLPVPAAMTAWRKTGSCTSPAANTPSMLVFVLSGFVTM